MSNQHTITYRPQSSTIRSFHRSPTRFRCIVGPLGSGKTTATIVEMMRLILSHPPLPDGTRRSRTAILRNTFPDLINTTIRDWLEVVGEDYGRLQRSPTIEQRLQFPLDDNTSVDAEILFLAQDKPDDVKKLRGTQLTFAWGNEASELPKPAIDMLDSRVGRFPRISDLRNYRSCVVMDTNAPDDDAWLGQMYHDPPPTWEFFIQPPAATKVDGQWRVNDHADNISNLRDGYYQDLIHGKSEQWIRRYVANEFIEVIDGRPVHPSFQRHLHVLDDEYTPSPSLPVVVGMDFGRTPSAAFGQLTRDGWIVFHEIVTENASALTLGKMINDYIRTSHPNCTYEFWGDPAGSARSQSRDETVFDVLDSLGINANPAPTNDPEVRYSALDSLLEDFRHGVPRFRVTPSCKTLIRGLAGKFQFRRMQVTGDERYQDKADKNLFSHVCEATHYMLIGTGETGFAPLEYAAPEYNEVENDPDFKGWHVDTGIGGWRA